MKINKLWIQDYKKYHNKTIYFTSDETISKLQKELFGDMNIILLSGENGAGKTTILSFIALIFRYLQRDRVKCSSDYMLDYDITLSSKKYNIVLRKKGISIFITINGETKYIQEFSIKNGHKYLYAPNIDYGQVTFDEIRKYLPHKVFLIGNDYAYMNVTYAQGYIAERLVSIEEVSHGYAYTSRGQGLSMGTAFIFNESIKNKSVKNILKLWGFELTDYVDIFLSSYNEKEEENLKNIFSDYICETDSTYNVRFNIVDFIANNKFDVLEGLIRNNRVYINEFYIKKDGAVTPISQMSAGEKTFLFNIFSVCSHLEENSIIIWEEPETNLNIKWSKQLIPFLAEICKNKNIQLLLSSHSPFLIKYLFPNQILRLKKDEITNPDFNTFLANDTEINNRLFNDLEVNIFEKHILDIIGKSNLLKKEEVFSNLGESYFRFLLYKSMES